MKATIHRNKEIIQIDTENIEISEAEMISICQEKITEYYSAHKNIIKLNDKTFTVKIKLIISN